MQVDILIIGQGICGSFLSRELEKEGKSFVVIDETDPGSASRVASGVINPVTGRRIVKTWMIEELLPFAWNAYTSFGEALGINCIQQKKIVDFFPTPQMKLAFENRYKEDRQFLALPEKEDDLQDIINYDFGYGIIQPVYWIDLSTLLSKQRCHLLKKNCLKEAYFEIEQLQVTDTGVHYGDITASSIIFCDGANGFNNPYFKNLPYGANKGEALLLEIEDLPTDAILKKGYNLVPYIENIFWLGSTYLWEYINADPSPGFYEFAKSWLKQTLKLPFTITHHLAAIRPATLERRPFVGFHPVHQNIGILNGMGTKGCSLAPYFARQLAENIIHGTPILPEADVQRFKKVLSR
ncbi:MAG TPA: FAD-binding oxidoreductase [Chitinophaga sp.]|nr:FAD-binding oxidoreductase [Chitinophaga sp.]